MGYWICIDYSIGNQHCNLSDLEESNKRRLITLHSFRRFTKSTISDLGYSDFSEYFIGHSRSTYYAKTDKQITEIFRKIEPHLTFLDYASLERKGADVLSRIDILEQENAKLRHRGEQNEDQLRILSEEQSKLEEQIKSDSESKHRLEQLLIRMMKLHPVSPEFDERLEEYIKSRNEAIFISAYSATVDLCTGHDRNRKKSDARNALYWKALTERGIVVVFGPILDPKGVWGLAVVEAADEPDARALGANDPAVKAGLTFEVYQMPGSIVRK